MLTVIDHQRLRDVCERYGIASIAVFGSVARGTADDDSDIDLLYTLVPGARLGWAIEDLNEELEQGFGRPVDLVSRQAIHVHLRDSVLAEARPIYAAA